VSKTKIEWATHTVNWLAGCTKVSAACTNCYAETMSARIVAMGGPERYRGVTEGRRWTGRINYDPKALLAAFDGIRAAKKPRRVFVNSMSDTFHDDAPRKSLEDLHDEILKIEWARLGMGSSGHWPHVLMLLTKRPANLLAWQREYFPKGLPPWVWVGCTVEDQDAANERVPLLIQVKTQGVLFLSMEPLLGFVNISAGLWSQPPSGVPDESPDAGGMWTGPRALGDAGIGWCISGGESGPKARPSHPDWFKSLRDQCVAAGVPFHFKAWGKWANKEIPAPAGSDWSLAGGERWVYDGDNRARVTRYHDGGRELDGRTWDETP